jgi:hypothetical protein
VTQYYVISRVDTKVVQVYHVQAAVREVLVGELIRHADSEGNKAIVKFNNGDSNLSFSFGKYRE